MLHGPSSAFAIAVVVLVAFACGPAGQGGRPAPRAPVTEPAKPAPADRGVVPPHGTSEEAPDGRMVVNHVLGTGQSLAVGVAGGPPHTTTQPFANLMFNTGVMAGGEELTGFELLVEGDFIPGSKVRVETMSSAFANLTSALAGSNGGAYAMLVSVHGSGAKPYAQLKRGTKPFANGMAQVSAAQAIAKGLGRGYVVRAVTTVHGESDHAEKNTHYDQDLLAWQADYEREVRVITGQSEPVPMFETQISSWTKMMRGTETSAIPLAQLAAHRESAGKVVLVGPKYHLAYAKDGVHLTSDGYRHMGEDYAKAFKVVVIDHKTWEPLRPLDLTRAANVITVTFAVPVPPLVLDTQLVTDPGNFGFEYTDASAVSPTIVRVEVVSATTVAITLSAAPTADDRHLRYAYTGVRGERAGPRTGPRGNLRDSDSTPSRTGHPLFNWCVHFDEAVP